MLHEEIEDFEADLNAPPSALKIAPLEHRCQYGSCIEWQEYEGWARSGGPLNVKIRVCTEHSMCLIGNEEEEGAIPWVRPSTWP